MMYNQGIRIPWNKKIKEHISSLLEQVGSIASVILQVYYLPTDERLLNSRAVHPAALPAPAASTELRIGSTPLLLVQGYAEDPSRAEQAVRHLHDVLREYLQNQAEIESFSREVLDNYQIINMLYRVADALGNIQDVNRVASIILHQAVAITHAERGSVLLLDKEAKYFHVAAAYGFSRDNLDSETFDVADTLCSKVIESGKPLIVEDIRSHPELSAFSKGNYKTGSFISLPLQTVRGEHEKRILGVLNLSDKLAAESFKSNDLKLLNALTSQAAVVIANAQVLKELTHSEEKLNKTLQELMQTYEDLEKRAVFIDQLNKIALSINATLDLEKLFAKIRDYAKTLTNAEAAVVYCPEDPGTVASPPDRHRLLSESPAVRDLGEDDKTQGFFDRILLSGKPVVLEQPQAEALNLDFGEQGRVHIENLLGVPFVSKGKTIGTIAVVNKRAGERFGEEDQDLLTTLGNQVANAVENAKLIADQKALFLNTIMALAAAVDAKDPYTHNHSRKVAYYAGLIGQEMNLSAEEMGILERTAILHDIGKIAIPESILNKPDRLTREEFEIMKTHPLCGVKIVEHIREMEVILPGMKYHHERYDGQGYPEGLTGDAIPLLARILAVADTYDAITSDRPYRKGPGHEFAVEELKRCSGTQFSPEVVDAFLRTPICRQKAESVMTT
ncbi:MAG: GAF domain-containing protein [Deltaproteobacteria bacterium]|nr:GAF domain-containing protein [Deltaproteobacteria bacterium]